MKSYFVWLAKLITLVLVFVVFVPLLLGFMAAGLQAPLGGMAPAGKLVAVIELKGMIDSSKDIVNHLYQQAKNDRVRGIVLRIESPGGAVGPAQEIYEAVSKLKLQKPIVVSMGGVAASGGLYAALGASKIFAQPGTLTGSVGVILQIPNLMGIAERVGVQMLTIKSGKFKDAGNLFREMTPEDREFLQNTVDQVNDNFIEAIAQGRGLKREEIMTFADGRVLLGGRAKELGLIDEIGGVYDAARAALELAGETLKPGEYPEIFYVEDRFARLKKFLEGILDLPLRLQESAYGSRMDVRYVMP